MAVTIRDILNDKGAEVATLGSTAVVGEVAALLRSKGIGAIVVVDDADDVVGLVSERDVVHALAEQGDQVLLTPVVEVMSRDTPTCTGAARVDDVAALMTRGRHRHVPVVEDDRLVGIVSVGDVVRSRMDALTETADQLRAYVSRGY
ncbi:MAG: CBS domain-containing protein [Nitriliruptor sp.]|nr:MAG: CBS domain-containing protein [Nitriliruptor sp.]